MNKSRASSVAGTFYPADKAELLAVLKNYFNETKTLNTEHLTLRALIVPHAGYFYSGQTAAWGYAQLPKNLVKPHFILIGPAHQYPLFALTGSSGDFWQTPLGKVPQKPLGTVNDAAHEFEHCLEVQLPFLQYLYKKFSVSCLLTGVENLSFRPRLACRQAGPESFIVISSDLSHYLSLSEANKLDHQTIDKILNKENNFAGNAACGIAGIKMVLDLARKNNWQGKLIYYDTSATASGDQSRVVGYAAIAFYEI